MSTRAKVTVKHNNGKDYEYGIFKDGYPKGVVRNLPDEDVYYEDFRKMMYFEDMYDNTPDYFYFISFVDKTIEIHDADTSVKPWKSGKLLFNGTFQEAKQKFIQ